MKEVTCGLGGKICTLQGSSTCVTRLQPFFKHPPLCKIRIMSTDLKSIEGIFDDSLVLDNYGNVDINIIFDADAKIDERLIKFLNDNYKVSIKRIKGVWTNLFLKETSDRVNFDMYPLGYKHYLYHEKKNDYIGNRGFSLKLFCKKLMDSLVNWFDKVWEKEELVEFEPIHISSTNEFRWDENLTDGGGKGYRNANYTVRNCIDENQFIDKKDYKELIKSDRFSYAVNTNATVYFYKDKVVFASDSKKSNNLAVEFYTKEIIDHIKFLVENTGTQGKTGIKLTMEELYDQEEISSEELLQYLIINRDNYRNINRMRDYYLSLYPVDGKRKFYTTLGRAKRQSKEIESAQDRFYAERKTKRTNSEEDEIEEEVI